MRKIIYAINVSLDGFIEDKDGGIGWSEPDETLHRYFNDLELELDFHLYGRRMYETMNYWRGIDTSNITPEQYELEYARRWQQVPNIVFSRTLTEVHQNDRLIRDNIAEEMNKLKAQDGKNMGLGGADLASTFMQLGLVDEFILAIHPVILGGGKPMFPKLDEMIKLKLIESRQFKSGVQLLRYQRKEA